MTDPPVTGPSSTALAPPRVRGLGFRARLTAALVAAAVLPAGGFGIIALVLAGRDPNGDPTLERVLLFAIAVAVVFGVLVAAILAADLGAPLRTIARAVDRVSAGDLTTRIELPGDDEFARLAESHNRLAADLERRNRELRRVVAALAEITLRDPPEVVLARAAAQAHAAFGMIDAEAHLGDPRDLAIDEVVPGEPRPVVAILAAGTTIGVITGHVSATRRWDPADQDLLDLFASEVAAAVRNAQLFTQVEAQNERLVELDAAKDDFLRGVSHNLQTPLASIRAYAEQLEAEREDRRLGIIVEQSERLSRMVRQLLTVSRIESGALRPRQEVVAVAPRVRRAWEALGQAEVPFALDDRAADWLAVADPDQLDQVLWALLDNAVHYGKRSPIEVRVEPEPADGRVRITIGDAGPGVAEADRDRLFRRFERGAAGGPTEGSGLGLYVSRELCRAMGGDLVLEPPAPAGGAAFTVRLPGEPAGEM